jgi:hypothetical protein
LHFQTFLPVRLADSSRQKPRVGFHGQWLGLRIGQLIQASLEQASVHINVKPFAELIAERTSWSMSKAL